MENTARKKKKKKETLLISPEALRQKLKLKNFDAKNKFLESHKEAYKLLKDKGVDLGKVRQHSGKVITAGALTGTLMLASPPTDKTQLLAQAHNSAAGEVKGESSEPSKKPDEIVVDTLSQVLPDQTGPLTRDQEKLLEQVFQNVIGVKAKATLEGEHLNTTYGKIGAEQHLRRYPGDTNDQHAPGPNDYGGNNPDEILKEGIAPGLGAWGYFAPSKEALTPDLEETERWYAVVQTLYLPDWNTRQPYLKNWYKYRKVLIVNTDNGKAVVASIADSGPAAFTGKQYGGSPEVMDYLGGARYKKGPVIVFFVDDPNNEVPLGPVDYQNFDAPKYILE